MVPASLHPRHDQPAELAARVTRPEVACAEHLRSFEAQPRMCCAGVPLRLVEPHPRAAAPEPRGAAPRLARAGAALRAPRLKVVAKAAVAPLTSAGPMVPSAPTPPPTGAAPEPDDAALDDAARLERWLRYQVGFLEASREELRRRLRRRTLALVWVLVGALAMILVMASAVVARAHGVELPPLA
jgi:hypothetical protein